VLQTTAERALGQAAMLQRKLGPVPVVVLVEGADVDVAVALMRTGVSDVIALPADVDELAERTLTHFRTVAGAEAIDEIAGESAGMQEVRRRIASVAGVESTVLIQGETGTGKGLVARAIHALSSRAAGPFVHVDCAALSPTLVESEFFGHEKGSFTGAATLRRGRFELAGHGTIFLDEIGDLEPALQSKLLRVLQDRTFERVGGSQPLRMHARVIAATSRTLLRSVQEGRFRADLYFRLNVFSIHIPALRERRGDIAALVRFAVPRIAERLGVQTPAISQDFCDALLQHPWPGNVRELLNVLERCLVELRVDRLEAADLEEILEPESRPAAAADSDGDDGPEIDETALRVALIETGGNVSRAARRLGIMRGKIRYRMRKFGLEDLVPDD
jgi:two-component system NtrC family response regulator